MPSVVDRMREALNRHDLVSFLECFDETYQNDPSTPTGASAAKNRSSMFESFPDFEAQLLRHATDEGTAWSEWHWRATGVALNEGRETAKMIQGF
jgi:SnoaL-like domain